MTDLPLARRCWRTLEPYHGVVYFAPEAVEEYEAIGIVGRRGYFASRSAAMGAVEPDVVVATFFNFEPRLVREAMTGAWDVATPDDLIRARLRAVDRVLRRVLGDDVDGAGVARAAQLSNGAAAAAPTHLGPLGAAHAALERPDRPHLALWHDITVLRECRGDGHLAALRTAGLSGIDALHLHCASGEVDAAVLKATRAWSDRAWETSRHDLHERGLLRADWSFTDAGLEVWREVEAVTDRLMDPCWLGIGGDEAGELRGLVRPWSRALGIEIMRGG